eukprot:1734213-Rhodomonas_salina.1
MSSARRDAALNVPTRLVPSTLPGPVRVSSTLPCPVSSSLLTSRLSSCSVFPSPAVPTSLLSRPPTLPPRSLYSHRPAPTEGCEGSRVRERAGRGRGRDGVGQGEGRAWHGE